MALPATDWSSLCPDLVRQIGDVFLAGSDVDYYMSLRAVCRSWRAATEDPGGLSRRFRPHRWVMLDNLSCHVDSRHFLNVDTGRILWKEIPLLNNRYTYIGTDDGLLVLEVRHIMHGYDICILNPFTGFMVRFRASQSHHMYPRVAMGGGMTSSLLFVFFPCNGVCYDSSGSYPQWFRDNPNYATSLCTVASFQGCVYGGSRSGSVMVVDRPDEHTTPEITTIIYTNGKIGESFLVNNAGELLLVHVPYSFPSGRTHVFRVNLELKAPEPIKSIGNRAIFLGQRCCLSINADCLPAIQANCIYLIENVIDGVHMYQCNVGDGSREVLTLRPLSIVQVIMEHCRGDRF